MNAPVWQLKKDMCDVGRNIWLRGFCAGNEGNHSVRIGDDRVLCTPTGVSKGDLHPEDICVVDMDGKQVEGNAKGRKRTSEVLVHLAIYKKLPGVRAVIHSHPPHAVAFCLAGMPLPEGIHPEAEVFLGRTVFAEYATPGGPDLPNSFLHKLTAETNTILMANHGSVSLGKDLTEAYYRLEILDNYAKQLILAHQLGRVQTLSNQQMTDLLKVKERFGFPDARLQCAPEGCIGVDNRQFLASFGVTPMSARSPATGGKATHPANDDDFEKMVQTITDQIMGMAG